MARQTPNALSAKPKGACWHFYAIQSFNQTSKHKRLSVSLTVHSLARPGIAHPIFRCAMTRKHKSLTAPPNEAIVPPAARRCFAMEVPAKGPPSSSSKFRVKVLKPHGSFCRLSYFPSSFSSAPTPTVSRSDHRRPARIPPYAPEREPTPLYAPLYTLSQ